MTFLLNFLYNLDRAVASLFGAKQHETVSSTIGRKAEEAGTDAWDVAAKALDAIDPGHTYDSMMHADALEEAEEKLEASKRGL